MFGPPVVSRKLEYVGMVVGMSVFGLGGPNIVSLPSFLWDLGPLATTLAQQ